MRRHGGVLMPEAAGGYSVAVPSLPGCFSEGETVAEALTMARDAIASLPKRESVDEWPEPDGVIVAEVDVVVAEHGGALVADNRARIAAD